MSEQLESNKTRIYVNDDLGNAYYVNIQNKYTHDGNGGVSNIKVFSQTFSERDSLVEIGEFKDGRLEMNDTGLQFFSGNIEQFQNESQKITAKVTEDLNVKTNEQKDNLLEKSGKKNVENTDEGIVLSDEKEITEKNINDGLQNRQIRERYGNYCYPMTMKENSQDRIKISVIDFRTPTFDTETNKFNKGDRPFAFEAQGERKIRGSATLPIPNGVTDFNAVRFGEGTLDPIQVLGAGVALAGIRGGFTGAGDQIKSAIEGGVGDGNTGTAVSNLLTSLALGIQPQQLLARTQGAIFNNNLALLFGGPTLRPFTFNFNVSPRDQKESIEVQKIIRMFKQASAVQRTTNGLFLGSPHVFSIEFIDGNLSTHKFLPRVKDCALLSFSTNYMPNNSYMTYENSSMVSYTLQFQFQELEPIFNDNYDEIDDFDEPRISDDGGSIAFFEGDSGGIGF